MGRSSDSDNDRKKRKKKKRKRSKSRSASPDSRHSHKHRKSKKTKSKHRSESRSRESSRRRSRSYSKGRSDTSETSRSYDRRRSRSRSYDRHRSRSRSYDRRRSRSRERYSRRLSRSGSRGRRKSVSSDRRSGSRSRDRYSSKSSRRRSRDKSCDRYQRSRSTSKTDVKEDSCANIPGFSEMTPAEQTRIRMQMALKAAVAADEKLRGQAEVQKVGSQRSFEESLKFTQTVQDIEGTGFSPQVFKSSRSDKKIEKVESKEEFTFGTAGELRLDMIQRKPVDIDVNTEELANPDFFGDPEEKIQRWIQKLGAMRRKKLEGEVLT